MRTLVCLGVLAIALPAHAEMMCDSGPMPAQGVRSQTKVAGSGGVIITANALPDWRFRDVNRVVRPRVTVVAPGLALFHPPPVADPEITLEDPQHAARVRVERVLKADPALPAPAIKRVTFVETSPGGRASVMVELAEAAVPKGAVIAVISRVDGAQRIPMSWTHVRPETPAKFPIWHTPFTCELHIDAMIQPKPGETVEVSWLDESGRVSEPSNAATIARAKDAK